MSTLLFNNRIVRDMRVSTQLFLDLFLVDSDGWLSCFTELEKMLRNHDVISKKEDVLVLSEKNLKKIDEKFIEEYIKSLEKREIKIRTKWRTTINQITGELKQLIRETVDKQNQFDYTPSNSLSMATLSSDIGMFRFLK